MVEQTEQRLLWVTCSWHVHSDNETQRSAESFRKKYVPVRVVFFCFHFCLCVAFDDFRCVILEIGRVGSMAPKIGRIYKARVTVAVGNGKGIYGVATAMDDLTTEAIVLARQQAFYNLQSVNLVEGRTIAGPVYHNYHNTYMNLRPQPAGFGIRAHRMLKRIVDVAGVKDIHITVIGPSRGSPLSKINCLLRALQEIESPQERANKTGYNVVRIDPQRGDMPKVVARPNVERGMIKLKTKPYPLTDKYMKQKLHIDFFNVRPFYEQSLIEISKFDDLKIN